MSLPPIRHTCCRTGCFQEFEDQENYPCWGNIVCIDTDIYVDEEGYYDEYRTAACEGHIEMYPSWDKSKYNQPPSK